MNYNGIALAMPYVEIYKISMNMHQHIHSHMTIQRHVYCILKAKYYLEQCWLITNGVPRHLPQSKFLRNIHELNPYYKPLKSLPHVLAVSKFTSTNITYGDVNPCQLVTAFAPISMTCNYNFRGWQKLDGLNDRRTQIKGFYIFISLACGGLVELTNTILLVSTSKSCLSDTMIRMKHHKISKLFCGYRLLLFT